MAVTYELWELESRNIIAAYSTEPHALAAIAGAIHQYGIGYVDTLALIREDGRGRSRLLAQGADLAERALAVAAAGAGAHSAS